MTKLTKIEGEILDILGDGEAYSAAVLAEKVGVPSATVRRVISGLRRKFNNAHNQVKEYVLLTKSGYSIKQSKENLMYEAGFRFRLGCGILYNGRWVFSRCKQLKGKDFNDLKLEFKPKVIEFNNVINLKSDGKGKYNILKEN